MDRDVSIDYLRSFVTLSVVAHHSALAYTTFSNFDPHHYKEATAPIVDAVRFPLLDVLVGWNDLFFMSLMFFVSGLFVMPSIMRKGPARFLADRAKRLGIPFIIVVTLLSPMTFYPSWLLSDHSGHQNFLSDFFSGGFWNPGPLWFISVLLAFCLVVAGVFCFIPGLMKRLSWTAGSSGNLAIVFVAAAVITTVPVSLTAWPDTFLLIGPLGMPHPSRVFLYFIYFLLGTAIGGAGMQGSLSRENLRYWPFWLVAGALSYIINAFSGQLSTGAYECITNVVRASSMSFCCAFTSLALLGIARNYFRTSRPVADHLSGNAYGIYIFHYFFVIWIQYVFLFQPWPAVVKFTATFSAALAASWTLTALLRKTPFGRVI